MAGITRASACPVYLFLGGNKMKTRKLLAVVLAVAMLASFISVPVFAEGEGAICEDLGILVGTGDGVTEDYLASTATRAQAALIHPRLFGLEADALAF